MKQDTAPTGVARFANVIVNVALALTVVGTIAFAVATTTSSSVEVTVPIRSDSIRSLPSNAQLADEVPARLDVDDPTSWDKIALVFSTLPSLALAILVLFLIRGVVGSVRHGDPFVGENVRRLRWIGFALIAGGPILQIVPQFFLMALADNAGVGSASFRTEIPGTLPIVGFGVLLLAQVFAHGVRLRDDVEGTV